jgi:hypothetical protein
MPSKRQLAQMDPTDNMLSLGNGQNRAGGKKKKTKKNQQEKMLVKDLFGELLEQPRQGGLMAQLDSDEEDLEDDMDLADQDESL